MRQLFHIFIGLFRALHTDQAITNTGSANPQASCSQKSNWGGSPKGSSHTAEAFATDMLKWQLRYIGL